MAKKGSRLISKFPTKTSFAMAKSLERFGYTSKVDKSGALWVRKK